MTGTPSTASPVVVPTPSVACSLVAVTAPRSSDTALSVISSDRQREPPTVDEPKSSTEPDHG
jgi:hypothetical protein